MEFSFEIKHTQTRKGRGLFAKRPIKEGEEIFCEKPVVSVQFAWNQTCKYRACHQCLKSLETAEEMYRRLAQNLNFSLPQPELCDVRQDQHVACPACKVYFCSQECFDEAFKTHHQVLCTGGNDEHPIVNLIEIWKTMHYPPETFSIMLIARLIATIKQAPKNERQLLLEKLGNFCHATTNEQENIAHKLLGEQFKSQIEVLQEMLKDTLYEECVKEIFTNDGFRSLLALIGTNGQGIGTSSFSVWANNCDKIADPKEHKELSKLVDKLYDDVNNASGPFLDCEGSGLYVLQSTCNHSCDPNAQVTFPNNNHVLSLKATKNIEIGEEILISYLEECDRYRSRHSRQKLLKENYLFVCNCQLCQSQLDQPDMTSEEEDDDDDCSMDED